MTSTETYSCKVVLVGETGVGKTAIISRYIRDSFVDGQEPSTMASYISKEITIDKYNTKIKFDIWDTAGQEKYRSLTKFFYKDAAIAIMVYDITRKDSFEQIQKYWNQQLTDCGDDDLIVAIAGNKCDLITQEEVTENDAKEYANKENAVFQLTSAKKNTGINTLFQNLGEKFLELMGNAPVKEDGKKDNVKLSGPGKEVEKEKKKGCC